MSAVFRDLFLEKVQETGQRNLTEWCQCFFWKTEGEKRDEERGEEEDTGRTERMKEMKEMKNQGKEVG